jgi:tetratricopeptide (TPR) repeat protein
MSTCSRPGCETAAQILCSVCEWDKYCSADCQKLDWKKHKSICPFMKKLSKKPQPFQEVIEAIDDILASRESGDLRVLDHLLSFAEYQFGKEVTEIGYCKREESPPLSDWNKDRILHDINFRIANIWAQDDLIDNLVKNEKILPYLNKSISILNPWEMHLDSDSSNQSDGLTNDQKGLFLAQLCLGEHYLAAVFLRSHELDVAEGHCNRCLTYARKYDVEGKNKITLMATALNNYISLHICQDDVSQAVVFAEEAYNLVAIAYDPAHPEVQLAANMLIDCLLKKGDFADAERYAEVTYRNLKDGTDPESFEVAHASYNLADVIQEQHGDLTRAEELAREALRIRAQILGPGSDMVGLSCCLLAKILFMQRKLGDETKELFERSLELRVRNEGPDGMNVALASFAIGEYHHQLARMQSNLGAQRTQLRLAKSCYQESHRIQAKLYGPTDPMTLSASSHLANVVSDLSKL